MVGGTGTRLVTHEYWHSLQGAYLEALRKTNPTPWTKPVLERRLAELRTNPPEFVQVIEQRLLKRIAAFDG